MMGTALDSSRASLDSLLLSIEWIIGLNGWRIRCTCLRSSGVLFLSRNKKSLGVAYVSY
jgi:hypothetical protein